jgi:hypothetical protein
MEKAKYIRELKKLILKFHPDLCKNKNLETEYNEITIKLNNILGRLKEGIDEDSSAIRAPKQDYEYYRMGIKYYRNIHPDQLYQRNTDRTYQLKKYDEQLKALNKIFISFDLAEYFFNKLINDYPNSSWRNDAEDKLQLLKKLYKYYETREAEENPHIIDAGQFISEMGLKLDLFKNMAGS